MNKGGKVIRKPSESLRNVDPLQESVQGNQQKSVNSIRLAVFVLAVSCMILKLWDIIEYAIGVICGHLFEILSV